MRKIWVNVGFKVLAEDQDDAYAVVRATLDRAVRDGAIGLGDYEIRLEPQFWCEIHETHDHSGSVHET